MGYTPLNASFLTSTLLKEGPDVVAVFALILAALDRHGETDLQPSAAASLLRISDERAERAFEVLASPDPKSRTRDHEGRRIIPAEGGGGRWFVPSFLYHRTIASKANAVARQRRYEERKQKASASRPKPAPSAKRGGWVSLACEAWIGRYHGTAPGGRIGKALKPLVERHGEAAVLAAWGRYLAEVDQQFASPAGFASKYGQWARIEPKKPRQNAPQSDEDALRTIHERGWASEYTRSRPGSPREFVQSKLEAEDDL